MTSATINLTPELYQYVLAVGVKEHDAMKALREETSQLPGAIMQISPDQAQFMGWLIALIGAKKVIEIGTFTGYSSLAMALNLPEDGKIITCDVDSRSTDVAKRYWEKAGVSHKVILKLQPALDTLEQLLQEGKENSFDFVFIDADKANQAKYYEYALKLLRPGGVVALDNVLRNGDVIDTSVTDKGTVTIRELNVAIAKQHDIHCCLIPIGDGLTLVRKL